VNAFDPHGINSEQLHFLEILMLFCLLEESPVLSKSEIDAIDENLVLVAHKGRTPGLDLRRGDEKISLQDWASELCNKMKPVACLLDRAHHCENYFSSVKSQIASVFDPDLTPSARMLSEMRDYNEGFFHHAQRMSKHHYQYYKTHALSEEKIQFFEQAARESLEKQHQIEAADCISFDEYLEKYFNEEE
jgi:glutamate--cysteine ligase